MVTLKKFPKTRIQKWRHGTQFLATALLSLKMPLDRLLPNVDLTRVCLPVFQCHGCPLAQFACPVGVLAFSAAMHVWPVYVIGAILLAATFSGRLFCGWACPFGFIQDLLFKIPVPGKFLLPRWTGAGKFLALAGLVVIGPMLTGAAVGNLLYFCNVCPAGALEASLPLRLFTHRAMQSAKWVALFVPLALMIWTPRPFCKVMCPLGAILSLGNRISLFRIRVKSAPCSMCKVCQRACPGDAFVIEDPNTGDCIRCLQCKEVCPDERVGFS